MTAYDVRARARAGRMLNTLSNGGKGLAVTLTREVSSGAYNTSTGTQGTTTTTQTGSGVVLEYSAFRQKGQQNEPGSLIQAGDKQLLLSALNSAGSPLSPAPEPGDRATIGGVAWLITAVAPLAPAGTAILYDCNVRGAA